MNRIILKEKIEYIGVFVSKKKGGILGVPVKFSLNLISLPLIQLNFKGK